MEQHVVIMTYKQILLMEVNGHIWKVQASISQWIIAEPRKI